MSITTPQRGGRNNIGGGAAIPGLLARRGTNALSTPPTAPLQPTSPIHQHQQQQLPQTHFLSLLDLLSEIPDLSVLHRAFVSEARGFHSKRAVVPLPPNRSSLNNNISPPDTPRPIAPQPPTSPTTHRRNYPHTTRATPHRQHDSESLSGSFRSSSFKRPPTRPSTNSHVNTNTSINAINDLLEREDAVVGIVPTHQESELGIPMPIFTALLLTYCKSLHTPQTGSHSGAGVKSLGGTGSALYAAFVNSEDADLLPRIHPNHNNSFSRAITTASPPPNALPPPATSHPCQHNHDPSIETALHALFSEVDRNGDGLVSWNDVYTYSFDSGQAALDLESATLDSHGSSKFSLSKQLWRSDNIYLCKYLPCTDIKLYQQKHGHNPGAVGNQLKITKSAAAAKVAMEAAAKAKHNLDQLIFADSPPRNPNASRSRAGSVGGVRPRGASVTEMYNNDGIRSRAGSVTSTLGNNDAPSMVYSGSSAAYFPPPHPGGNSNHEDGESAALVAAAAQRRRATRSILASLHRRRLRLYQRAVVRVPPSAAAVLRNESTCADKTTRSGTVGSVSGLFEGAGYSRIYGDPSSEDSPILDEEKEEGSNDGDPHLDDTGSDDELSRSISMSGSMSTSPRNNDATLGGGSMMIKMNSAADFTRSSSSHTLFPAKHLKGVIKLSGSLSRQNSSLKTKAKAAAATSSNNLMKSMMSSSFHITTVKVGPIARSGGASQDLLSAGEDVAVGAINDAPIAKPYLKQSCFSHSTVLSQRTRVEKIARVYARSRRQEIALLANHNKKKQHKNSSGRGDRIIVCSRHSPLQLLDAKTLRPVASFDEFLQPLRSTSVSAHGSEGNTRNAYFHTYDAIYGGNTDDKMSLGAGYDPNAKAITVSPGTTTKSVSSASTASMKTGGGTGVMSTSAANYSSTSEYFRFPDTNTRIVCADYLPSISTLVAFATDMKLRAWLYSDSRPDIPVLRPLLCDFYVTCMRAAPYSSLLMADGGSQQYAKEEDANENDGGSNDGTVTSSTSLNQTSLLYTGDRGGRITLYEINRQTLNEPRVVDGFYLHRANVGGVSCFCFVGDGAGGVAEKGVVRRIVSAGMDNDLLLTDIVTRKSTVIANTPCAIRLMEFVAPIHSVAAVGIDNSIGLWVTHQSRRPCTPLVDHSDPHMAPIVGLEVPSCTTPYFAGNGSSLGATEASNSALSTDHHIITTDRSGMVKVWDVRTFKCVQTWRVGRGGTDDVMGAAGGKAHTSRSAATAAAKSAGGAAAAGAGTHDGAGGGDMAEADEERIVWDGSTSEDDDDDTTSNHSHGNYNSSEVEDISGLNDHKHRNNNNKNGEGDSSTSPRRTLAGAKRAQQSDGANQQHHQRPSLLSKRKSRNKTTPSHGEGIVLRNSSTGGGSNLPNQLDTVVAGGSTAPAGVNATTFCGASRELICATPKGLVCYKAGRGRNKDVADDTAQTLAILTVPRPTPLLHTTSSSSLIPASVPIQLDEAGMPDVVTISARSLRFWKVGRQEGYSSSGDGIPTINNFHVDGGAAGGESCSGSRGDQNKGRLFLLQDRPKQQISMSSLQTRYENLTTFVSVLRPQQQQPQQQRPFSKATTTNSCPFTEREYIQFNSRQNEISCCCVDASSRRVFLGYANGDIEEVGVRGGSKLNVRHLGDDQIVRAMAGIDTAGMMLAHNKLSTNNPPASLSTPSSPKVTLSSLHLDIVFLTHSDVFKVLVAATGNGYLVLDSLPGDKPLPPGHRKRAALASAALNDAAAASSGGNGGVGSKSSSRVWLKVLAQKKSGGDGGDQDGRSMGDHSHPESITSLAISSQTTGYVVAGTNTGRIVLVDVYSPRVIDTEFNASLVLDVLLKERAAAERKNTLLRFPLDPGLVTVTAPDAPTPSSVNIMPPGEMIEESVGPGGSTLVPGHKMDKEVGIDPESATNNGHLFTSSSFTAKMILEALHHNLTTFTTPTPLTTGTNFNQYQLPRLGGASSVKTLDGTDDLTPYTLAGTDPPSSVRDVCFIQLGGHRFDEATSPTSAGSFFAAPPPVAVPPTADDDEIIATLHKNGYIMFWTLSERLLRAAAGVGCFDGLGEKGGTKGGHDHSLLPAPSTTTVHPQNNPPPRPPTNNSMRGSRVGIVKLQHQQSARRTSLANDAGATSPTTTTSTPATTSIPADRPKGGLLYVARLSTLIAASKRHHTQKKEEVAEVVDAVYEAASQSPRRLLLAAGRGGSVSPRRRLQTKKKPKAMFQVVGGTGDEANKASTEEDADGEDMDVKPNNMRYAEELSSLIVTDVSGFVSIVRIDNLLSVLRGLRAGLEIASSDATASTTTSSSSPNINTHTTTIDYKSEAPPCTSSSTLGNPSHIQSHQHTASQTHRVAPPNDMPSFKHSPISAFPTSQRLSIGSVGNTFGMSSFWGSGGTSTKYDVARAAATAWPALPRQLAGKQPPRISTASLLRRPGNSHHTPTKGGAVGHEEMNCTASSAPLPLPRMGKQYDGNDTADDSPLNPTSKRHHRAGGDVFVVEEPLTQTAALRGVYAQYCDMRRKRGLAVLDDWLSNISTIDQTPENQNTHYHPGEYGVAVASNPVEILRGLHFALEHSINNQLPLLLRGGGEDGVVQWGREVDPPSYDHLMGLVELLWGTLPKVEVPTIPASPAASSRPFQPRPPLPPPHGIAAPYASTSIHNISIGSEHHSVASGGPATFSTQEAAELLLDSKETYELRRHSPSLWFGDEVVGNTKSTSSSEIESSLVTVSESFRAHSGDILALDVTPNLHDKSLVQRAEAPLTSAAEDELLRLTTTRGGGGDAYEVVGGSGVWGVDDDFGAGNGFNDNPKHLGIESGRKEDALNALYRSVFVYSVGNDHKARQWCIRAIDTSTQSSVEALYHMLPPRRMKTATATTSPSYGHFEKDADDNGAGDSEELAKRIFLSRLRSTAAGLLLMSGTGKKAVSSSHANAATPQQPGDDVVSADGSWDVRVLLSDNLSPDTPAPSILPPPPPQPTTISTASPNRRGSSVSGDGVKRRRSSSRDGSPMPSAPTSNPTTLGSYFLPRLRTGSTTSGIASNAAVASAGAPPSSSPSRNGRRAKAIVGSLSAHHLISPPPPPQSKGTSTTLGTNDRIDDIATARECTAPSGACSLPLVLRLAWLLLSNNSSGVTTTNVTSSLYYQRHPRLMSGGGTRGRCDDDDDCGVDHLRQLLPNRVRHVVFRLLTYSATTATTVVSGAQVPLRHLSISGLQSTPLHFLPALATPPTTHLGPTSSPANTPMMAPNGTTSQAQLSPRVIVSMSAPRGGVTSTTGSTDTQSKQYHTNNEQLATLYSQTDRVHHRELKRDKEVRHIRQQARRLSMSLSASYQQHRRSTLYQGGSSMLGSSSGLVGEEILPSSSRAGCGEVFLMGHSVRNDNNQHNNQKAPSASQSLIKQDDDRAGLPPDISIRYSEIQALQQRVDDAVFKSAQERWQLKLRQRRLRKLEGGASSSSSEVSATVGNDGGDNIDEFLDENNLLLYGSDVTTPPHEGGGGGSPGGSSMGCASSRNSPFGRSIEMGGRMGVMGVADTGAAFPPLLYSDGTSPTTTTAPQHRPLHVMPTDHPIAHVVDRNSPVRVLVDRASSLWDAYYSPSPLHRQSK